MFGRPRPVRDAADDVGEAAREITDFMRQLKAEGVEASLVLGGPFDGKEIPVKLRIKVPKEK